ncbi:MAG: PAS domain-containing sensor histidine kinase [Proteobacteria bacterium]|nr:PAS domain-containing sensor histidine kinase [Pseudomonadota bacterium]MBU1545742.1 PAS domain-containing sensor histidine kinase [Pseudomonadota bacterium]MBU2618442.1 PAS domain-containing sensor histidine kinase [Pseudomonadota bacterium]
MNEHLCPSEISQQPRCSRVEIETLSKTIGSNRQLLDVLDAFPGFVLVLNHTRQIIFANQAFLHFLGAASLAEVLGKKPGDALACEHAVQSVLGCGTTVFCSACGAAKATPPLLLHQPENGDAQECRIRQEGSGKSFDFRVQTAPFPGGSDNLYLFYLTDISHEKRRRALERIFFHDVANIANGMVGLSRTLCEKELGGDKKKQFQRVLHRYAHRLSDEVEAQSSLAAAENNDLHLAIQPCATLGLLEEVASFFNTITNEQMSKVEIGADTVDKEFFTDPRLLHRILINMTKNGIEASPREATVRIGCKQDGSDLEFWVHNQGCMPEQVQMQIFQRSFSTKGSGRGLGTYSIKLLGERYLKGRVSFSSSPEEGTTFRFRCPGRMDPPPPSA